MLGVIDDAAPSYTPLIARPTTSTIFSIERVHPNFGDATVRSDDGDSVRRRTVRLGDPARRQRASG
jgi:hypothetical protein